MTLVKRNASLPGVTEFCIVTVALLWLLNAIWSTLLSLQYCSECSSLYVYCIWVYGSKYPTIRTLCVLSLIILVMFCLTHAALTPLLIRQIYFYTHTHTCIKEGIKIAIRFRTCWDSLIHHKNIRGLTGNFIIRDM